ncbi:hypothetical protein DDZ14_13310 [Maritimibacter sp. 55A14]|uniref:hypothetical protein n=1 Tax=Maritimibacter sp. 55A14 TaxID=2174844 RepID=UPI000D6036F3|nr:hypothetical protein [Maritimibacter sp. 55A14]PWE31334.1 hypothetical protein DDZ14_13310 [Maritimibacter sp. 55A14]
MTYADLDDYLARGARARGAGPVAVILVEDRAEVDSTIRHHMGLGFRTPLVLAPDHVEIDPDLREWIDRIPFDTLADGMTPRAVNRLIAAFPGHWIYYCYNAEYLFFPFCESRTIGEMLGFVAEERRASVLTYVIDLYASDLSRHPDAVSRDDAHLDLAGYYALARPDENGHPKERQLDFFGGLRWRFEEHIPPPRRRIDRIGLFVAKEGLELLDDHTFSDPEYNTYACPWHNNLTAAVCSFRTAKALKTNAGSTFEIPSFAWYNSGRFEWHSQQLMDLGLMEPGQWF